MEVARVLKGPPAGSTLVVRVLGGERPDGMALKIFGAPHFREGDRALLFLTPHEDGVYRITQFMLGAFHRVESGGQAYWLRNLAETREIRQRQEGTLESLPGNDRPRAAEAFTEWLTARGRGESRPADY